jgi:hypothetical protein
MKKRRRKQAKRTAPLSAEEREQMTRARERERADAGVPVTAKEILSSLIESRNINSAFDRALALSIVNSVCGGDLASAVRGLALLPPATRTETGEVIGASAVRAKVLQMVLNAVASDETEQVERDTKELDQLRAEVADLRRRLAGGAPVEGDQASTAVSTERVVVPTTGNIMTRGEWEGVPPMRGTPLREPVTIDAKAEPAPAPPAPTVAGRWDESEHGRLFREWRAAGGLIDYL